MHSDQKKSTTSSTAAGSAVDVRWHEPTVSRADREKAAGQRGCVTATGTRRTDAGAARESVKRSSRLSVGRGGSGCQHAFDDRRYRCGY